MVEIIKIILTNCEDRILEKIIINELIQFIDNYFNQFQYQIMQLKENQLITTPKHSFMIKNYDPTKIIQIHYQYTKDLQKFQSITQCKDHKQQILFCCFDCKQICCCSKCISIGKHKNHDIKNLHRGYVLVETCLNEFLIRFTTKIDLYSLWHEKLNISKSEIIEDYTEFKKKINNNFKQLRQQLEKKNQQIIQNLEQQMQFKENQINNILINIRNKMKICMDSHSILQKQMQCLSQIQLCKYYSDKKNIYQQLLKETNDPDQKQFQKRTQIFLNTQKFNNISNNIKQLTLKQSKKKQPFIRSSAVDIRSKQKQFGKNIKIKKNEEMSPIYEFSRKNNIQRESHPTLMFTPKQFQSDLKKQQPTSKNQNKIKEFFLFESKQSRKTHKMFSMPSSPLKDKKQTPLHHILEAQKQSFLLAKRDL